MICEWVERKINWLRINGIEWFLDHLRLWFLEHKYIPLEHIKAHVGDVLYVISKDYRTNKILDTKCKITHYEMNYRIKHPQVILKVKYRNQKTKEWGREFEIDVNNYIFYYKTLNFNAFLAIASVIALMI